MNGGLLPRSKSAAEVSSAPQQVSGGEEPKNLMDKKDLVVWLKVQPAQRKMYEVGVDNENLESSDDTMLN